MPTTASRTTPARTPRRRRGEGAATDTNVPEFSHPTAPATPPAPPAKKTPTARGGKGGGESSKTTAASGAGGRRNGSRPPAKKTVPALVVWTEKDRRDLLQQGYSHDQVNRMTNGFQA